MQGPPQPAADAPPRWSWGDFAWSVVGGLIGALVGGLVAGGLLLIDRMAAGGPLTLPTADQLPALTVVLVLFFQNAGHLVAVALVGRRRRARSKDLRLGVEPGDVAFVALGVVLQFAMALLFAPLLELFGQEQSPQEVTGLIATARQPLVRAMVVLGVALLAPLTEELLFRGLLLRTIEQRHGPRPALIGSAAVFSVFHLLGVTSAVGAMAVLAQTFLLGLVLGRLVQQRDRLGPAIFTHSGFNLVAVIVLMFFPEIAANGT
ncbi:MAG: lysostaphin resistance A-like protein [Acidimicrobiia bacterium]